MKKHISEQIEMNIVCPDCSEGPDKCSCDNGVKLPSNINIGMPNVKIKEVDHSTLVEAVQQSFPFMNVQNA